MKWVDGVREGIRTEERERASVIISREMFLSVMDNVCSGIHHQLCVKIHGLFSSDGRFLCWFYKEIQSLFKNIRKRKVLWTE